MSGRGVMAILAIAWLLSNGGQLRATPSPTEWDGPVQGVPYAELFNSAGDRYGIDPSLLAAIGFCESSYDPQASSGEADGLMQFTPRTARQYGVEVSDPASSVDGAARYLLDSIDHLGTRDPALLAASYNAGRYGDAMEAGRIPQNDETPGFVDCVVGVMR